MAKTLKTVTLMFFVLSLVLLSISSIPLSNARRMPSSLQDSLILSSLPKGQHHASAPSKKGHAMINNINQKLSTNQKFFAATTVTTTTTATSITTTQHDDLAANYDKEDESTRMERLLKSVPSPGMGH